MGIFAASMGTPSRAETGATFYGVMEMSGNLWERPVTIGNSTGRAFSGVHGDGGLAANGNANAGTWPGANALGAGFRGGAWRSVSANLRVSGRNSAALTLADRGNNFAFRAVRSAP